MDSETALPAAERLPSNHRGEVLEAEFLEPMGVTAYRLAKAIGVSQTRVTDILHGRRAVSPDTALRLSRFFGTSAEFWLNLQNLYDLEHHRQQDGARYSRIPRWTRRERAA